MRRLEGGHHRRHQRHRIAHSADVRRGRRTSFHRGPLAAEGSALGAKLGSNRVFMQTDVTIEAQMKALIAGRLAGFSLSMVYGAAKAAVIHLTKCVAMELGAGGIRVNSISPGAITTGIFGKALGLSVEAAEQTAGVMREAYKSAQPIPPVIDGAITGRRNWSQQHQGYVALRKAFDSKTQ